MHTACNKSIKSKISRHSLKYKRYRLIVKFLTKTTRNNRIKTKNNKNKIEKPRRKLP